MKLTKLLSMMLMVSLLVCATASAQDDSGKPGSVSPANPLPTTFRTIGDVPDGVQPTLIPGTGPVIRVTDEDNLELAAPVYMPICKQLQAMSTSDKANSYIQLEPLQGISAGDQKILSEVEKLWNNGDYTVAIDKLSDLEESSGIGLGMGVSWIKPKELGVPDWGNDVQVETRKYSKETRLDFHLGTGNLFAVNRRLGATDNVKWTTNISTNGGKSWSETYTWSSSLGDMNDVSAVVAGQHLYIAYVPESGSAFTSMRLRRCMTSDGSVDLAYSYITVFDKGVDIEEVSLASNEDYLANRVYILAILQDNSLIYYWDDYAASSWTESPTGITDASSSLDTTCNENYTSNFLIATYKSASNRLNVAKKSATWVVDDLDDMDKFTSISAYGDYIFVAYEFYTTSGTVIKYRISYNGGTGWSYGYVSGATTISHNFCPSVAARKDGGIYVIYQQEAGPHDPVLYRNRDYATVNWSDVKTFNEIDALTGRTMDLEWLPISSGKSYGAVWPDGTEGYIFDRSNALLGSLNIDTNTITESAGGEVTFLLVAGVSNKNRKYIILGSMSGSLPGTPLPKGLVLPINWDVFTSGMIPFINSPIFDHFIGNLNSLGQGKAKLSAPGALPPGLVGAKMTFAFACNKPWNYASNAVTIYVIP